MHQTSFILSIGRKPLNSEVGPLTITLQVGRRIQSDTVAITTTESPTERIRKPSIIAPLCKKKLSFSDEFNLVTQSSETW